MAGSAPKPATGPQAANAPQPANPPKKTEAPSNLHVLNADEVHRRSFKAQRRRRRWTLASFVLCVLAPLAVVAYYYLEVAADRYAVETKFAIRSPGSVVPSDLLGIVSSMSAATSTTTDSHIVQEFIHSRDLVDRLEGRIDIRAIYDNKLADPIMRLDSDATKEDMVSYLERVVSVYYDTSSQILTLEVQAFTPEDAQQLSAAILAICEELVNNISEKMRQDTMRSAEKELARVEAMLDDHRSAVAAFRESEQDIDPSASVSTQIQLLGELESELAAARTRMTSLTAFLDEDAPSVRILKGQISAMEDQVAAQRGRLGTGADAAAAMLAEKDAAGSTLTARVGAYEDLAVDLQFLQGAYVTALAAREAARVEADRAQRYLAAFVQPSLPEKAVYPARVLNILIFGGFAVMLWGIGVMLVYVIREHST